MTIQQPRPLFPLFLFGRIFAVPSETDPSKLGESLSSYFAKPVELHEKALGGYNYAWEEKE